jgi:hypothetical protein
VKDDEERVNEETGETDINRTILKGLFIMIDKK